MKLREKPELLCPTTRGEQACRVGGSVFEWEECLVGCCPEIGDGTAELGLRLLHRGAFDL